MADIHYKNEEKFKEKNNPDLKWVFVSVMLIGLCVLASWFGVYSLFTML
ncbi:cytochrome c oxidase subunit 2A [Virgibacillus kekensis]|uniref:Cytochrome c oxidase subunit 2A n=1 Tax=Virgibacillus kekensis TaxID=202261 RepID=A0ABV9DHR5_9BACI